MDANGDLSKSFVTVYTVVYLVSDGCVLLLHRSPSAPILAGCYLGVGGHVEPGEELHMSAMRECEEERGLIPRNLRFRGTLVWTRDLAGADLGAGFLHIFTATSWDGEIRPSAEGELLWVPITALDHLERFPEYQRRYIPKLLIDPTAFIAGFVHRRDNGVLEYQDSDAYFAQRALR